MECGNLDLFHFPTEIADAHTFVLTTYLISLIFNKVYAVNGLFNELKKKIYVGQTEVMNTGGRRNFNSPTSIRKRLFWNNVVTFEMCRTTLS